MKLFLFQKMFLPMPLRHSGKMEMNVTDLGVDYLCLSAHKISGPKGVGALYCQNPDSLEPLIHGGSREKYKRGGRHNVPVLLVWVKHQK